MTDDYPLVYVRKARQIKDDLGGTGIPSLVRLLSILTSVEPGMELLGKLGDGRR